MINGDCTDRQTRFDPKISWKVQDDWTFAIHQRFNIKRRTCVNFIPKEIFQTDIDKQTLRCGCNRLRREHSWDITENEETVWDVKKHTQPACCNAFGYLPNNGARYMRCDIETQPNILVEFMFSIWKMPKPRLILCIIGGAKYFKLNERLEKEFIKGIIQAALKADGWIVTSGFKTGVVQLVGEAIHDHQVTNPRSHITAIGCSKWGATRHRESLIIKTSSKRSHHESSKNEKGQQILEPNHSHFLLLDDGTYFNYDTKDYRTRLLKSISSYQSSNIPCVTIVVEGGPDTLIAIYNDLSQGIPIVLIDGSGRVPNLLAKYLKRTQSIEMRTEKKSEETKQSKEIIDLDQVERLKNIFLQYEEEIREDLKAISKGSKTSNKLMDQLYLNILYCLQPNVRKKIKIFSLDSDRDLDDTIFEAIIQAKQNENLQKNTGIHRQQLLQLALDWDALAIAKEQIIKDDLNDLDFEIRERLFFEALRLDRPQFVQTFIKLNFDVQGMFFKKEANDPWEIGRKQLVRLYDETNINKNDRVCLLRKCQDKPKINDVDDLDRILRKLIGDYMKPIYGQYREENSFDFIDCCRKARITDSQRNGQLEINDVNWEWMNSEEIRENVNEIIYRDLFLWSILTNRIEMSKVFLSQMRTRICACLFASKIFKSYIQYAADNETKEILNIKANEFEHYAEECLKYCYNYDEDKACEIAIRRLDLFGGVTCLQVAVDADDKNFVGQPCCDQLLNKIWYDKIEPFQTNISKRIRLLIGVVTFGLFAPMVIPFRSEQFQLESMQENRTVEIKINDRSSEETSINLVNTIKRLNETGINYSDNYINQSAKSSTHISRYFRRLKYFHQSPIIKYSYNCIGYLVFLLLFAYFLLFDFRMLNKNTNLTLHWTEIVVILIISSMLIEEIRQFSFQENRSLIGKLSNYFVKDVFFNMIRVTSYILFYIGLILRCIHVDENRDTFTAARIVLAYDLELWFLRSFTFLGIAQKMGPKLVMIRKMIIDLFFFTYIILTAMTAYGVASRAMFSSQYNLLTFDGRSIFRQLIYPTYYLMYGNVDVELEQLDVHPDDGTSIATHILLAFHMLFVNILLINLLIAMFSFTFESVQKQTDLVWRYERYSLIREYFDRPPLFPPLILLTHLFELFKFFLKSLPKQQQQHFSSFRTRVFKMIAIDQRVEKDWSEFENYATNLYVRSLIGCRPISTSTLMSNSVPTNENSLTSEKMTAINSSLNSNFDIKSIVDEVTTVRKNLSELRVQSEEMSRCIQWMMDAMDRVRMSKEPKPNLQPITGTTK